MKVLVAEDDRATRARLAAYLAQWGHDVTGAADGAEAWGIADTTPLDLIITDWRMPGIDGIELLRRIRTREFRGHDYVFVILLTSRSEKSDIVEGMGAGADDFVAKPFDKDELRVRVQAAQRIVELEHTLAAQNRQLESANRVLSAANRRMLESLEAAARIQQSYLPGQPPDSDRVRFAWLFEPCEQLAGDSLNIVPLGEDEVGVYIADVSGHGVPAALLSVHLGRELTRLDQHSSLIRHWTGPDDRHHVITPPAVVMGELNRRFACDGDVPQYFTGIYGVLHTGRREFRFSSAGHPGPVVVSGGEVTRLDPRPPAVGLFPDAVYSERTLQLEAGDRLYFYTDGLFEAEDARGEEFGEERLLEVFRSAAGGPLDASLAAAREAARAWAGADRFGDDVSVVGVEIC